MAIRTTKEYFQSLRDGRVVYSEGERVKDVTKDRVLGLSANVCAWDYEAAQMPEYRDTFVAQDEDGETISFVFVPAKKAEDLFRRREIIQTITRICMGMPAGAKFTGIDCLNSITVNSRIIDQATGSNYTARVEEYRKFLSKNDLSVVAGVTDVKGDRSLRPSKQVQHKDFYLHIVDETKEHGEDGIIIRGAKMFTSLSAVANEIICLPTRAMGEEDKDYAVACAVPVNAKGVTVITSMEEFFDERSNEFDYPLAVTRHTGSGATIYEDVFVPMDRVFLNKEWKYSPNYTYMFADFHRLSADAYKYIQLEIMCGIGKLLAEYNGLNKVAHINDKLSWLVMYAESVEALGRAACQFCVKVPGTDLVYPDPTYSNCAKFQFASNYHEAIKILQDLAGGLPAAVFSSKDYFNPKTKELIDKYFAGKSGIPTEHRIRLMRLVKDLTNSFDAVTTLHAEGSLAAQRLSVFHLADWDRYKASAKRASRIDDGTKHPTFSNLPKFPREFE